MSRVPDKAPPLGATTCVVDHGRLDGPLHVSSGAFLRMCGLNFARCESVQPSNAMACSNLRMQRGRPTKSSRAKRFRCFDRVQLFLLRSDSHSVEVDGMTPWKTTFLYKQEVISTSM